MIRRTLRFVLLSLRGFSILVGVAAMLCGARAFRRNLHYLREPTVKVLSPEVLEQVRTIESRVPAGAVVLHVCATPEYWYSRLLQRALYPRNDTVILQPPFSPEVLRGLEARYGSRFAISQGDPPEDPGFVWRLPLGRASGARGEAWLGELPPW